MSQWHNKTILITGAGSGIGRALATLFAQKDAKLVLTDINVEALDTIAEELVDAVVVYQVADVSNKTDWERLAKEVESKVGSIDALINNAGMSSYDYFDQTSEALFDKVMNVNFNGVVLGCRTMLPLLEKSAQSMIVNVSSVFGIVAAPMLTPYHASKFAVRGFTESLRQEMMYRKKNIDIICVMPGGIKTNIANNTETTTCDVRDFANHFNKITLTTAEQAAKTIVKGMNKKRFRVFIGPDAWLIRWINRLLPEYYFKIINPLLGVNKLLK